MNNIVRGLLFPLWLRDDENLCFLPQCLENVELDKEIYLWHTSKIGGELINLSTVECGLLLDIAVNDEILEQIIRYEIRGLSPKFYYEKERNNFLQNVRKIAKIDEVSLALRPKNPFSFILAIKENNEFCSILDFVENFHYRLALQLKLAAIHPEFAEKLYKSDGPPQKLAGPSLIEDILGLIQIFEKFGDYCISDHEKSKIAFDKTLRLLKCV